jgi:hypothetical protein
MLIPEGTGFIYFIQAGGRDGPIKIGRAKDPLARLADLQVANHERLRLLMTIADNGTLEITLHKRFNSLRIHGEWFRCDGDLEDVLWLSGLVPHPETLKEIEQEQMLEFMRYSGMAAARVGRDGAGSGHRRAVDRVARKNRSLSRWRRRGPGLLPCSLSPRRAVWF